MVLLAVVLRTNFRTASYEPVASQGLSASGMVGWLAFDTFDATEAWDNVDGHRRASGAEPPDVPDGRSSSERSNARSIEPSLEEPARADSGVCIGPRAGLRSAIRVGSLGAGTGVSGGEGIGLSLGVAGIAGSPVFAATLGVTSDEALGCGAKRADRGVEEPQLPPPRPVTAESVNADGAEGAEGAHGVVCAEGAEGAEATGAGTAGAESCNRGTFGASPSLRDGNGNDLSSSSTATEATISVFGRSGGGGRQCGAA